MIEQWKPDLKYLIASGLKQHGMAYRLAIQSTEVKPQSHKYLLDDDDDLMFNDASTHRVICV